MISLEENGKQSSGKQARALHIKCFLTTDHTEQGDVETKCCPADDAIGNCMMKGSQGIKFDKFGQLIMGFDWVNDLVIIMNNKKGNSRSQEYHELKKGKRQDVDRTMIVGTTNWKADGTNACGLLDKCWGG